MLSTGRERILLWAVAIGIVVFVFWILIPEFTLTRRIIRGRAERSQAHAAVTSMATAVKSYLTEYGFRPEGDNAQITATLRGDNPRKIVFFEAPVKSYNPSGELIDPWGTPCRFDLSGPETRIWSCGRDRVDNGGAEGSDDIVSWR